MIIRIMIMINSNDDNNNNDDDNNGTDNYNNCNDSDHTERRKSRYFYNLRSLAVFSTYAQSNAETYDPNKLAFSVS